MRRLDWLWKPFKSHLRIKTAGNVVAIQLDTSTTQIPKSVNAIPSTHVTMHVSITIQDEVSTKIFEISISKIDSIRFRHRSSGSCDSNPCGDSGASCVILPAVDHIKIENNVYLDYMCVCPSGQKFDYSSGSCQSEDDPLLCNCAVGIANCMWMSADLGFYCGCKDGGRDTRTSTGCFFGTGPELYRDWTGTGS